MLAQEDASLARVQEELAAQKARRGGDHSTLFAQSIKEEKDYLERF